MMKYLPLFTAIEDLLYTNNAVLIPQLGTFLLEPISAELYLQQNEIIPPKVTIKFDPNLINDDGILLQYLYETQGVSERTCRLLLEKWLISIHQELQEKFQFEFPKLGTIVLNNDGLLSFNVATQNLDISKSTLPTLQNLIPVARLQEQYATKTKISEPDLDDNFELDFSLENDSSDIYLEVEEKDDDVLIAENQTDSHSNIVEQEINLKAEFIEEKEEEKIASLEEETQFENITEVAEEQNPETSVIVTPILETANVSTLSSDEITQNSKKKSSNFIIYILLGLFLLCLLIWIILKFNKETPSEDIVIAETESTIPIDKLGSDSSKLDVLNNVDESRIEEPTVVETVEDISKPMTSTLPNAKTYIIVIGAFAEQKYVDRSLKLLKKEGYFPNIVTTGKGLQRIGVEISCTKEELKLHLKDIRQKFHPEAWVVKD